MTQEFRSWTVHQNCYIGELALTLPLNVDPESSFCMVDPNGTCIVVAFAELTSVRIEDTSSPTWPVTLTLRSPRFRVAGSSDDFIFLLVCASESSTIHPHPLRSLVDTAFSATPRGGSSSALGSMFWEDARHWPLKAQLKLACLLDGP